MHTVAKLLCILTERASCAVTERSNHANTFHTFGDCQARLGAQNALGVQMRQGSTSAHSWPNASPFVLPRATSEPHPGADDGTSLTCATTRHSRPQVIDNVWCRQGTGKAIRNVCLTAHGVPTQPVTLHHSTYDVRLRYSLPWQRLRKSASSARQNN